MNPQYITPQQPAFSGLLKTSIRDESLYFEKNHFSSRFIAPLCIKCQIGFNKEFQKLELRIVKYSKSGPLQKLESRIV
jgi:hypothetical protein